MANPFVALLESHAAQLRAEALEFLHGKGVEYAEALDGIIHDIRHEDSEHKRIVGLLAEIGFLEVFAGAARAGDV